MTIVCCLFVSTSICQTPAKESNPNAPEITFGETTHDFGTVPFKGEAECEFTFTNTGKEPLIIQRCQSTCGCTVPACPSEKPIKPGEKGTIKAKYTTTNVAGTFNKSFTVYSNAKNSPVTITIKGEVAQSTETAAK
jgi:hypothetical protein